MTDKEIIETMARAIFAAEGKIHADNESTFQPVKWEELDDDDYQCVRDGYRQQATAAITALRAAALAVVPRDEIEKLKAHNQELRLLVCDEIARLGKEMESGHG